MPKVIDAVIDPPATSPEASPQYRQLVDGLGKRGAPCTGAEIHAAEDLGIPGEQLLADVVPWLQVVQVPDPPPPAPACRDPFDLPFIHLAIAGRARALVSGDRDLLALAGAPGLCTVLSVDAFCRQYLAE